MSRPIKGYARALMLITGAHENSLGQNDAYLWGLCQEYLVAAATASESGFHRLALANLYIAKQVASEAVQAS